MGRMRRAALLSLVLVLPLLFSEPASARLTTVDVVEVNGPLDRPLVGYLQDRIDEAERGGHVLVLQLDTAGTLDQDAVGLAERLFDARVPVIVWVGPAPARASGAGLLFMYASSLAAVSPGSQTGPLVPLDLADGSSDLPDLRARIDAWVAARGKETVTDWNDRPLTAAEARHRDIAQAAAVSVPELLGKIDGTTVETAAGPVTLQTEIATEEGDVGEVTLRFQDLGPIRAVLHAVSNPSALYLLLWAAIAALAFELTQPGFGFAGFSGLFLLGLAGYSLSVVPVFLPGLALLLVGVGLLVLDVKLRRLGPLTWVGLLCFLGGSLLVFQDVAEPVRLSPWAIGFATAASLLYYGFGLTVALQARDRIASTQVGLVGLLGETRGELAPEGPVFVKGSLWRGRSGNGPIPPGTRVRVRGVDGLILRVEPEAGDED